MLIKVGTVFDSHAGGTSGPIWGTAFLKAGLKSKGKTELTMADLVQMGRAIGNVTITGVSRFSGPIALEKRTHSMSAKDLTTYMKDHLADSVAALESVSAFRKA